MSNDLLKALNAAADAAHIAALKAHEAAKKLKQIAEALDSDGRGFSRAVYTGMRCEWFAVELLNATEDVGEDINSTPRSRGVELPKKTTDEKLQDFVDAPTVKTPWGVMTNARYGLGAFAPTSETTQKPLKLYTWLKSNTVLTRPQEHSGSIRTHHPDAVALNVYGAQAIIECCRKVDLYLAKQDIWECEYIDTNLNGCIRFKCIKIVETY